MPFTEPLRAHDYPRSVAAGREAGLSKFFAGVYGWLGAGVAVTAVVSLVFASMPQALRLMMNPFALLVVLMLQMGIITTFSARASSIPTFAAANLFFAYAALLGAMLSPLGLAYPGASIAQALMTASAAFVGLGVYGATTRRNLMGLGQYLMIGLIGGLVLMAINIFIGSSSFEIGINIVLLFVFLGMIAWDHQRLKDIYAQSGTAGNVSLIGAFMLYGTFVNLTLTLLRLFGGRRED